MMMVPQMRAVVVMALSIARATRIRQDAGPLRIGLAPPAIPPPV
jgi:hypothetical protein